MNDIGTKIIAAGLVDEGLEFERLEKENQELKDKLKSKDLICPYCLTKLEAFDYQSYYDGHYGWSCNCEKIPNAVKWRGSYA